MDRIAYRLTDDIEERIVVKRIATCEECPLNRYITCPEQRNVEAESETPSAWLIGLANKTIIVSPDDERFGVVIPESSKKVESAIATCKTSGNHMKPGMFKALFPELNCSFRDLRRL